MKISQLAALVCSAWLLNACATHELFSKNHSRYYTLTETKKQILMTDEVIAFGKSAQSVQGLSDDALVIAGKKNSYVLTQGGGQLLTLLSRLNPKYIKVENGLQLFSPTNNGEFSSTLRLEYRRLISDLSKNDMDFLLQNHAKSCQNFDDQLLTAKSFCFDISLAGRVYPAATNVGSLKAFSKSYPIEIYTNVQQEVQVGHQASGKDAVKTLVLFPFAVAFDVITLPFQALHEIFD